VFGYYVEEVFIERNVRKRWNDQKTRIKECLFLCCFCGVWFVRWVQCKPGL